MLHPRIILETDMHNNCGLVAAATWRYLTSHGVKARIFVYQWGPDRGHRCVIFESGPKLAVYDEGGTRTLHHATWDTPPKQIAVALLKAARDKSKITKAQWE